MSIKHSIAIATLLGAFAGAAFAGDAATPEQVAAVTEKLTAEGYEVRSVQTEDGMLEAYAMKDGEKLEIYLNDAMEIVEIKKD